MNGFDTHSQYILGNLDRAITENWIRAFYMPIVRATSGKVCEEEALARWIDPDQGTLAPADFIPVLEQAKLIYKLDLHIVDEVLKKMKGQMAAGLYLVPISVNLSRTDFDSCDIVEEICERVDKAGIPREKLIIEITESVLGEDFDYMKLQIDRFQSMGFSVWMDDFGSGYSSVDVLQDIGFDHIKFDIKFMQRFGVEKSRIMLTELVRMAMSLGIRTVTEGVETEEQADFLREIGCNKLQGFLYCKPISLEEIIERNKKGIQIGFENPAEGEYYDSIGCINLYDLSVISGDHDGKDQFRRYFDTLPIAVYEADEIGYRIIRCNSSYSKFEERYFEPVHVGHLFKYTDFENGPASLYSRSVKEAAENGERIFFTETLPDGTEMRAVVRRLSVNHIKNVSAVVLAVLEIMEPSEERSLDFSQIAQALSADYIDMYYVNINSEKYVEYSPDSANASLSVQKSGDNFFATARADALKYFYSEDSARFVDEFTKENVLRHLKENDTFRITYRLMMNGEPIYVSMKAVRMNDEHIIIGVSNVDAQMKLQKEYDKVKEERLAYSRIMALAGNYIVIYIVNPETDSYEEYGSSPEFEKFGISKSGEDFFQHTRDISMNYIYSGDVDLFNVMFAKDKMLEEIGKNGAYMMIYRLMINGKPEYVCLKASLLDEESGQKLIVGISYYS